MRKVFCDICKCDITENVFAIRTGWLNSDNVIAKIGIYVEVCRDCQDDIVAKIKMWMNGGIVSK